jgi:hypothetical protein
VQAAFMDCLRRRIDDIAPYPISQSSTAWDEQPA